VVAKETRPTLPTRIGQQRQNKPEDKYKVMVEEESKKTKQR
jgi:hypothetical protein